MAQGDLGFFSLNKKQYGGFFLAVNTYSGYIHVSKISNTRLDTLVGAVGHMVKVTCKKRNKKNPTVFLHHDFLYRIKILWISEHYFLTARLP